MTGKTDGPGPRGGDLNTRNTVYLGIAGFGNALLLSKGDQKYVDTWRDMLAHIRSQSKEIDGVTMYPQNFGAYSGLSGETVPVPPEQAQWYDYSPTPYAQGAVEVWYCTQPPRASPDVSTVDQHDIVEWCVGAQGQWTRRIWSGAARAGRASSRAATQPTRWTASPKT